MGNLSRNGTSQPLYIHNIIILNPDGPAGRSVRLKAGRVVGIDGSSQENDAVLDGQGSIVIPGLINAHDHLELNTFKRLKYRERYSHSRQWIEDIEARFDNDPELIRPRQQPLEDRLLVSAMKNLLAGVTMVCHHNPLHKALRRNFPVRIVAKYGFCHSLFRGDDPQASYQQTNQAWPWIIHLAEGVDAEAEAEFDQLDRLGAIKSNTILVHGVGLTASQRQTLIERGGGLIWCPASNDFLFGRTACVQELTRAGKVALGSDSRLSGADDLLAELRAAAQTEQLSAQQLFKLITVDAARLLRLPAGFGEITVGGPADLVLLPPAPTSDPFLNLLNLSRADLRLVILRGQPLVVSPSIKRAFENTWPELGSVQLDGVTKFMPSNLVARLKNSAVIEPGLTL